MSLIKIYNKLYNSYNIFIKNLNFDNTKYNLGRWCHISLNKCSQKVIEKKIDFANKDNTFDLNKYEACPFDYIHNFSSNKKK